MRSILHLKHLLTLTKRNISDAAIPCHHVGIFKPGCETNPKVNFNETVEIFNVLSRNALCARDIRSIWRTESNFTGIQTSNLETVAIERNDDCDTYFLQERGLAKDTR